MAVSPRSASKGISATREILSFCVRRLFDLPTFLQRRTALGYHERLSRSFLACGRNIKVVKFQPLAWSPNGFVEILTSPVDYQISRETENNQ